MDLVNSIRFVPLHFASSLVIPLVYSQVFASFFASLSQPISLYLSLNTFQMLVISPICKFCLAFICDYATQHKGKCCSIPTSLFPHTRHNLSTHNSLVCSCLPISLLNMCDLLLISILVLHIKRCFK